MRLNRVTDVIKGKALTAEITNERWNKKLGYKLSTIKPKTAARRLLKIASRNKFALYEYFLTDYLGHGRYDGEITEVLKILDEFLLTVIKELDEKTTLIICSDHGNFEDLSTKTHTLNPSLTITAGEYAEELFKKIKDLSDIKSAITDLFK
jgi:phosphopentomutase